MSCYESSRHDLGNWVTTFRKRKKGRAAQCCASMVCSLNPKTVWNDIRIKELPEDKNAKANKQTNKTYYIDSIDCKVVKSVGGEDTWFYSLQQHFITFPMTMLVKIDDYQKIYEELYFLFSPLLKINSSKKVPTYGVFLSFISNF